MPIAYDVVGFGEASIDEVWRLPPGLALGDKDRARGRDRLGGGQVATALVAAARLGARAAYLGPIGDDAVGAEIVRGLADDHVMSLAIPLAARSRTALVLVASDGDRTVVEDGGVSHASRPALPESRALHVDGTYLRASLELAREAKARGMLVSIDLDFVADADGARELVALADLCVLSEGIAERFGGLLAVPTAGLCAESRGPRGLVARLDGALVELPAFPVDVVDTTACGDTLRGALVVAWLDGRRDRDALRYASAAAALKCRDLGRRGCPTRTEVEALLTAT
ncbi:MAG: PfkB family carbohydrate kinase [Polyangia bacterium]